MNYTNYLMAWWLSGERSLPFGLLVYSGWIRTLVAMVTYDFDGLIMMKVENDNFCRVIGDI